MLEIKDLAGISEPLKKLIEVVSQGVGGISRPMLTRKNADAKAYEIKTIAQAISESQKLLGPVEYEEGSVVIKSSPPSDVMTLPDAPIDKRVLARITYQEAKRQSNVEQITQIAADELSSETDKIEGEVDSDWTTRFFRIAEDVSNEQMQSLWGKVLAGEVKKPGSYSLRTLELLKNITQSEAELFSRIAKLAIISGNKVFVFNQDNGKYLEDIHKITFNDLLILRDLGLLYPTDLGFSIVAAETDAQTVFTCGTTCFIVLRPKGTPKQEANVIVFTEIGKQLLQFIDKEPCDLEYMKKFTSSFKGEGATVQYGQVLGMVGNSIQHTTLQQLQMD